MKSIAFTLGCTIVCALLWSLANIDATQTRLIADEPQTSPLPAGELGRVIELGREIVEHTKDHPLSKPYVGNSLNCTSCHLDAGTHPKAASFIGTATAYPAWSPREKRVVTLQDRTLNCFMRSQNGIRPPVESEVAVAITAYITWLSAGQPIQQNPEKPLGPKHTPELAPAKGNVENGLVLYAEHCASCHAENGSGSDDGPAVWGDQSYNDGAGLSREAKLASWLKVAMPLDDPHLSDQEAFDIAAYVNSHTRPKFRLSEHLPNPDGFGEYNAER